MKPWKIAVVATGVLAAAGAGVVFTPVLHGQETFDWKSDDVGDGVQALEILRGGTGRIGVSVRDVEDADAKQSRTGVMVDDVTSGGPADKAGLKSGDAIVDFDGERVRSVRQFTRLAQETPVGRSVSATVLRAGQRVTVTLTPERGSGMRFSGNFNLDKLRDLDRAFAFIPPEPPEAPEPPAATPRPPRPPRPPAYAIPPFSFSYRSGNGRLGVSIEDLTDGLSEYFGVKHGALVRSVTDGTPAAKAGLKAGDVITAVNGSQVEEPSDVTRALDRVDQDAEVTLEIVRDKKAQTLKVKLEPRERVRPRARTTV